MIGGLAVSVSGGISKSYAFFVFRLLYSTARICQLIKVMRVTGIPAGVRYIERTICAGWAVEIGMVICSAFMYDPSMKDAATALFIAALFWATVAVRTWSFFKMNELATFINPAASHLSERFGLFTIIVSGEAAVNVIEGAQLAMETHLGSRKKYSLGDGQQAPLSPWSDGVVQAKMTSTWVGTLLGFITILCIWWLYFDSMNEHLIGHGHRFTESIWELAHFVLFIATTSCKRLYIFTCTTPRTLPLRSF